VWQGPLGGAQIGPSSGSLRRGLQEIAVSSTSDSVMTAPAQAWDKRRAQAVISVTCNIYKKINMYRTRPSCRSMAALNTLPSTYEIPSRTTSTSRHIAVHIRIFQKITNFLSESTKYSSATV
jgi:hypothetical protein